MALLAQDCLVENAWICPEYVQTRADDILAALREHVTLTVVSVALGFLVALPLALLARRYRPAEPAVLGVTTALYSVPSLALFALLLPFTGLGGDTVVIGLVLYSLTILVRNIVAGLDGVPEDVREAARGMGYGPLRLLFRVEMPLALPTVMAGLRVATVSTVALVTVGTLVGAGGLGDLIYSGLNSSFKSEVLTASVLCVLLAVVADLVLLGVQRLLTPWHRGAAS
ncbi:MAG: ABC transporter permease [Actinomycetes bacterium]